MGLIDGLRDFFVGGDARGQPFALQEIKDPASALDVVVGQIQLSDLRVGQLHVIAVLITLKQLAFDHPVDFGVDLGEILAFDGIELAAPQVDDLLDLRVGLPSLQVLDCAGVVLPLDVQRAGLTASGQPHRPATGDIMANLTDGADRVIQGKSRKATPLSIISSTSAAVPTLSMVVVSDMLESPTMTCSRRYFSASACGSSRVLIMGRDRVVALETPSQMCSARWLKQ